MILPPQPYMQCAGCHSVTLRPRETPATSIVGNERILGQPSFVLKLFLTCFFELVGQFCITQMSHVRIRCCAACRSGQDREGMPEGRRRLDRVARGREHTFGRRLWRSDFGVTGSRRSCGSRTRRHGVRKLSVHPGRETTSGLRAEGVPRAHMRKVASRSLRTRVSCCE